MATALAKAARTTILETMAVWFPPVPLPVVVEAGALSALLATPVEDWNLQTLGRVCPKSNKKVK